MTVSYVIYTHVGENTVIPESTFHLYLHAPRQIVWVNKAENAGRQF